MTEKRWLYFALGVTTVISIGAVTNQIVPMAPATGLGLSDSGITFPDGTAQTTAAPADPRLAFFITTTFDDGLTAREACGPNFHMAQLWEILDPSNLRYATGTPGAVAGADGPIPTYWAGWVRTGWRGNAGVPGEASCDAYSQNTTGYGTYAFLHNDWSIEASAAGRPNGWLGPWAVGLEECSTAFRVWCVEDFPGAAG